MGSLAPGAAVQFGFSDSEAAMTPAGFIAKWSKSTLSERSACQQHFLDLCDLLGQPKPAAADPDGAFYTFEKGVKTADGQGWADVWFKGHFAWEYKGKHKDLVAAYKQLLRYREELETPPLLVVCDMDRFQVHTNFTGTRKVVHEFDLAHLDQPANLDILRKLFTAPEALRPGQTTAGVTEEVAEQFAKLADGLRRRGVPAPDAAHFLMKLTFCMFAEDIELLPKDLFTRTVANSKNDPAKLTKFLKSLFTAMAHGDYFGADEIAHFNGGLFADADVIDLTPAEIGELLGAAKCDWSSIEPSIFGTLFERTLDPDKRSQLGAHYTSREDILTLLEPVVFAPLKREWAGVKEDCDKLWAKVQAEAKKDRQRRKDSKGRRAFDRRLNEFAERLSHVTVLDPACGSGNFLYLALNGLLDLEKQVLSYASMHDTSQIPLVQPGQLAGLEVNPYAQQLASVVIWIGYLQWKRFNGYDIDRHPVLKPMENIHRMDAILDLSDPDHPAEPDWPAAEFIVGNPPFLGYSPIRQELGEEYTDALFSHYKERLSNQSDLCCYWFEKARGAIAGKRTKRAGLLATQSIRGGKNREVLQRIEHSGAVFFAVSDKDWVLDGANVHISIVGFDDGEETEKALDGRPVAAINSNLSSATDVTKARRLRENGGIGFVGGFKFGSFDLPDAAARPMLSQPSVGGRPNSDVLRPWINGLDVLRRRPPNWIVDFGIDMAQEKAALFDGPFEHVSLRVKPERDVMRRERRRQRWWIHGEVANNLRAATETLPRYLVTPRVAKHRVFAWVDSVTVPDGQLVVFARQDDYSFGVLHSRVHEYWALKLGTRLETRPRYTPTTCFETFPLPTPTADQTAAVAAAAKHLDELRTNWLNPPEWTKTEVLEFPGSVDGPWARYVHEPNDRGVGTVRYPRLAPKDEAAAKHLQKRTLTNLYNARPEWLRQAHDALDRAVFAAYGWDPAMSDDDLLAALLALNLKRQRC